MVVGVSMIVGGVTALVISQLIIPLVINTPPVEYYTQHWYLQENRDYINMAKSASMIGFGVGGLVLIAIGITLIWVARKEGDY